MHPLPINRWQWEYWLDGAGSWLERWHCTGNDGLLAFMVCSGVLWMVAEYFRYAYLVNQSEELFPDPAYRERLSVEYPQYELGNIEPAAASKTLVQLTEDLRKIIG